MNGIAQYQGHLVTVRVTIPKLRSRVVRLVPRELYGFVVGVVGPAVCIRLANQNGYTRRGSSYAWVNTRSHFFRGISNQGGQTDSIGERKTLNSFIDEEVVIFESSRNWRTLATSRGIIENVLGDNLLNIRYLPQDYPKDVYQEVRTEAYMEILNIFSIEIAGILIDPTPNIK